jgi:proton glutamate symport protein
MKFMKTSKFKIGLTSWIFIALILGLLIGLLFPQVAHGIKPLRTVFLNGVKCIIGPLIFSSIVMGINSSGGLKNLGRLGWRSFVWFEIATTVALGVGLLFVNWLRPGDGLTIVAQGEAPLNKVSQEGLSMSGFIEHLMPHNFVDAVAKGDVLQIVIFSVLFGVAILLTGEKAKPVLHFCEGLSHIMFKFTELIMAMAPIGVGAAMAGSIAEHGISVLLPMAKLVGTLYLALFVFVLVVLLPGLFWSGVHVRKFLQELRPNVALAFATTSSESAYPGDLKSLEKIGVPNRIASFVLPMGYSFNLDGSTLYLAIASIFIAQAANVELSLTAQLSMMFMLMLTTKGVAAVPRASLVVLSATLVAYGLPLEGIVLIMGVDEFMDMARTAVNLLGNCVATVVVTRWEGESVHAEWSRNNLS